MKTVMDVETVPLNSSKRTWKLYSNLKTLKDQTVMGPCSKQLKMECEIVYQQLEHVYGGQHKKPFLELELSQKTKDN